MFAIGTNQALGAIDDIGRALDTLYKKEHGKNTKELQIQKREIKKSDLTEIDKKEKIKKIQEQIKEYEAYNDKIQSPYSLSKIKEIKEEYKKDPERCAKEHSDIFYYLDGMVGVNLSQSVHPAGIVASSVTLPDNYGIMYVDGHTVLQLDMDAAHLASLIKYDILGLKTVGVINKTYEYLHKPYPRSYEINWNDTAVWDDICEDNTAIFQFESKLKLPSLNLLDLQM